MVTIKSNCNVPEYSLEMNIQFNSDLQAFILSWLQFNSILTHLGVFSIDIHFITYQR